MFIYWELIWLLYIYLDRLMKLWVGFHSIFRNLNLNFISSKIKYHFSIHIFLSKAVTKCIYNFFFYKNFHQVTPKLCKVVMSTQSTPIWTARSYFELNCSERQIHCEVVSCTSSKRAALHKLDAHLRRKVLQARTSFSAVYQVKVENTFAKYSSV